MATTTASFGHSYFALFEGLAKEGDDPNADYMTELIVLSFLAFMGLYGASHAISYLLVPYYRRLSYAQQADWCTRITSTAHALLTAQAGYRVVVLGEGGLHASPFHGYSTFVKVYSCVSVGYFLSDAVVIVRHFRTLATPAQNAMFIVHHLSGAVGYMICVSTSTYLYFGMFRLMSELSTPFVSLHCLMTGGADQEPDAKTRRNWLYLLNGSILISVFFVVRVVAIPFYYHIAVAFWQQWQSPLWLKALFVLFSLVGDSLNAIWFVGIMKGAAKTARQVFCDDADGAVAETDTKKDV